MIKQLLIVITFTIFSSLSLAAFDPEKPTILITGSNKGIGFSFVKAFNEKQWNIIATCRNPNKAEALNDLAAKNSNIVIEKLDVTNLERIKALSEKYKDQSIDILLNNAGVQGDVNLQKLESMDYKTFKKVMDVNAYGPIAMADAFLPQVKASNTKKIINISSYMGSIKKSFGILYFYRASKSALNMMMKTLAVETKRKGVIVGILDPGVVDTDLSTWGNRKPKNMLTPDDSVAAMMPLIDAYEKKTSGKFYKYDGKELPW